MQRETIERYLMGKLSLWELAEVEEKIKTDTAFSIEVNFQRDILIAMTQSRKLQLKEKLKQVKHEAKVMKLKVDKQTAISYSIAASIVLLVTTSVLYPKFNNPMLAESKKCHIALK